MEFEGFDKQVQKELVAHLRLLEFHGPTLGRPRVDTLKGSRLNNMKELRFSACDGVWRFAFAFDPASKAVALVAGNKTGISEALFYRRLIKRADDRFDKYLREGDSNVQDT